MIEKLEEVTKRHSGIPQALADVEGQLALMMCMQQIGETMAKIRTENWVKRLPVKEAVGFRNLISHQYHGIDFELARVTIESDIPVLKTKLLELLDSVDSSSVKN